MDIEQLEQLLTQQESATLDFKRKGYSIDHKDTTVQEYQRSEMIKDILSLANGNASTVGQTGYLILGAADKVGVEGNRQLFDVDAKPFTRTRLLQIVNAACAPPVDDLKCDPVVKDGKQLVVIEIPPSPHLHETTRSLTVSPEMTYTKHIIFTRHGESIEVAAAMDRVAILDRKQRYFNESRKAPPIIFGAVVGAVSGGMMAKAIREMPADQQHSPTITGIVGGLVGGGAGALVGNVYQQWTAIKADLDRLPPKRRKIATAVTLAGLTGFTVGVSKVLDAMKRKKEQDEKRTDQL